MWSEPRFHGQKRLHASDEAYSAALSVFGEKDLVELTIVIATMNAINRMGISYRMKPLAKA